LLVLLGNAKVNQQFTFCDFIHIGTEYIELLRFGLDIERHDGVLMLRDESSAFLLVILRLCFNAEILADGMNP